MAHWIESEKEEFKKQLSIHGKNWKKIALIITNKTEKQIRNFYQNYKKKMNLEELLPSNDRGKSKKVEPSSAGLKRTRSFNRSISPFKRDRKKRKVISSDEDSQNSLSNIEEEKEISRKRKSDSDSSLSSDKPKKGRKKNKVISESSSGSSGSSSSSSNSNDESIESSLSSKRSASDDESKGKEMTPKYDTGSDLD